MSEKLSLVVGIGPSAGGLGSNLPLRGQERAQNSPITLGEVLYATSKAQVPEQEWATLIQFIAAGDQLALHALYQRAHRLVFTLLMRITANRETAEELTIDVFHDVWRRASRYDAANGTVLGWIMNQARSRAIDRLRFENRKKRSDGDMQALAEAAADPCDVLELREQCESLRAALATLTPDERQAIETTFFAGLTHAESRGAAQSAARHHQDAHSFRTSQTAGRADSGSEGTMNTFSRNLCEQSEVTCAYAAQALSPDEVAGAEVHIASCPDCQRELESLRPVLGRFVCWPADVLRPTTTSLQERLALRIGEETGKAPMLPPPRQWFEPEWEQVAPGIECKLLATDTQRHRVSMLVRLAPGASYPAHTHAGVEELHLLDGELWIDGRKLFPGDYNYGGPGAGDDRVWSETGCTCVLITSTRDTLRRGAS